MSRTLLHHVPPPGSLHEPRHREPALASTRASVTTTGGSGPAGAITPWAVVVDDDPDWLELVELGLVQRGYRVSTFERSDDALASADLHHADVAVVDYCLPGSDGVALCHAMHRLRPTLRTIVCTGAREVDAVVKVCARAWATTCSSPWPSTSSIAASAGCCTTKRAPTT